MHINYKPWTYEMMLSNKTLRYFIKCKGEEEKEVTLDDYFIAAQENNSGLFPKDHVPKLFIGKTASGHIDPEVLAREGILIV